MNSKMILFGYRTGRSEGGPESTMSLMEDGLLEYARAGGRRASFSVSDACLHTVRKILEENRDLLTQYAREINADNSLDNENCFIFGGIEIIDWDLTRWYLEEDRKKHPEYYSNSVKVELTETYVRGIFDEICQVIEQDEKKMRYARMIM